MRRVGERGAGKWEQITWDEAINTISEKWSAYTDEFGSHSIGFYWGSGNQAALNGPPMGLPTRLANILQWTLVDYCTDVAQNYGSTRILGDVALTNVMTDIVNANKVFMWGTNLAETWWMFWWPLADALEQGTQLITIDPNFSTTAGKSDWWISNRPGSDSALLLGIMQHIIAENLHDKQFLLSHTTAAVLIHETEKRFMRMSDLGVAPQEGPVSATTGRPTTIDPPLVWDLSTNTAVAIDTAKEPALLGSYTVNEIRTTTSFDLLQAMLEDYTPEKTSPLTDVSVDDIKKLALMQTEGNIYNIPGYSSQAYLNGAHFGQALALLPLITGKIGKTGNSTGSCWWFFPTNGAFFAPTGTVTNSVPVLAMPEIMRDGKLKGEDYPIKSLYIAAGNPVSSSVESNTILEWWDKIEFIVVADQFFNDSSSRADIVLPVTHSYENEDFLNYGYYPFMGVSERAVEPMYETKSDSDIARIFAEKFGVSEYFQKSNEEFARELLDEAPLAKELGITYDRLREEKEIAWGQPNIRYEGGQFPTETGRAFIFVENPVPRIDFGQTLDPSTEYLPVFFPPDESWPDTEAKQKYPLALMSERLRSRWHTSDFDNAWMLEITPEPIVKINPKDAQSRGIKNNDYVEVFNDRGHAVARAVIANDRKPGILIYTKGWQQTQFKAGSWSELTKIKIDPWAINSSFMDVVAEVRLWEGGE
jgi:molybdopterin-containing oxidoreductase family molybdopterin binding subunit